MNAKIELSYRAGDVIKKLDPSAYIRLRAEFAGLELPENQNDFRDIGWDKRDPIINILTTGMMLAELGIEFTVRRFESTYIANPKEDRHTHLHIAIPNIGLLMVDEVMNIDDACTDALQGYLNEGWRILAVCPPAMQRRPDYILGRTQRDR
jgi:hypothetical protein